MTTYRVRLLGFAVVLFLFTVLPALASNNIRIVRLSLVQGDVQIDRNAEDGWEQAINNMPVIAGARIYAAENSKAELEFEDGSSVRLVGPAQITMLNLSAANDGSRINQVQVDSGLVYVNARLHHHDDFRVLAPTGEIFVVTRPSHLRFTVDEQTASLSMLDGEVSVEDGGHQDKVRAGETYNYVLGQPESAARQETVPPQPADAWNQQRDAYNDQHAAAGAQYSGEDPNAPGTADLANYGQYSDIPGYGVAWQPYGVGPEWDPYGYGAWSYYPSFGWTFVSGYPWGWAPFYYGDWCFINGRGWWWRPGGGHHPGLGHRPGHGGGWHPRPRFTGEPGHAWNAPHPPTRVSRGTVAVAGSHIAAGPISATHGSIPGQHGFVDVTRGAGISSGRPVGRTGSSTSGAILGPSNAIVTRSNVAVGAPVTRGTSPLNPGLVRGNSPMVGRRGSYALTNDANRSGMNSGRTGYEVHRPPAGYAPNGAPVRSYAPATGVSGSTMPGAAVTGPAVRGAGAPVTIQRGYSAPPMSTPRASSPAPVSAPPVSSAPVSHGSMSPAVSSGGGGFHGGGGGFGGGGGVHAGGGGVHR